MENSWLARLNAHVAYPHWFHLKMLWNFLIALLIVCNALGKQTITSLNGKWTATSSSNSTIKIDGIVPGYIHIDLLHSNIIQDPYYRYNDVEYRWISAVNWTYSHEFNLNIKNTKMELACEGIDTVSRITINGVLVGVTNNQFKRYIFDVVGAVNVGVNRIVVEFQSTMDYAAKARAAYPYAVPHDYHAFSNGEQNRNFIRRQQSTFSWDWGPCFLPQGIWRPIYLRGYETAFIRDVVPRISDNQVRIKLVIESKGTHSTSIKFTITGVLDVSKQVDLVEGSNEFDFTFDNLENVKLWWPRGYGEQNMYNLDVSLMDHQSSITKRIAFRKVVLVQTRQSPTEKDFHFTVNDVIVFNRGANFIPMDSFERQSETYVDRLLQTAIEANMNTLRIWGGGNYQNDAFYNKCDENGIMIWQEFMFACSLYPRDEEFLENVRQEVIYNLRRLAHHPSILVWSGNNENEIALFGKTWYPTVVNDLNKPIYLIDYAKLFLEVIHDAVIKEDPFRSYVHSSPSNGVISTEPFVGEWGNPMSETMGDIHIFEYYNDCTDVKHYLTPRMATEYGWQSFPSFKSLQDVSKPEEDMVMDSKFLKHRQHHAQGTEQLALQIKRHFRETPQDLKDFIYLTQCVQTLCIKSQTEHYRRGAGTSRKTRGSIYWQFNDIWQAPSWASVEYSGKWKMLHYHTMKFYEMFLISGFITNDKLSIHLSNDHPFVVKDVIVSLDMFTWTGEKKWSHKVEKLEVPASSGIEVYVKTVSELMRESNCQLETCVLLVTAFNDKYKSENVIYFSPLKNNVLPNQFRVLEIKEVDATAASVTFASLHMGPYTFLDVENEGRWEMNGFLSKKQETKTIHFYGWKTIDMELFRKTLTIRSLNMENLE
jgi:beta-mannosidase